jgi:hypothetical protein
MTTPVLTSTMPSAASAAMPSAGLPTAAGLPASQSAPALPLRDLHLPDPISNWPIAPGWWLLAAVVLMLLIATIYITLRYWRRLRPLQKARQQGQDLLNQQLVNWQQHHNSNQLVNGCNLVLKRFCQQWYPDSTGLSGQGWQAFLADTSNISPTRLAPLASAGYQRPDPTLDGAVVHALACQWLQQQSLRRIDKNRCGSPRKRSDQTSTREILS